MTATSTRERPAHASIPAYTCGHCPARWSGLSFAHCGACHRTFSSVTGFDAHRLRGVCVDPAGRGLVIDVHGIWRKPAQEGGHWTTQR